MNFSTRIAHQQEVTVRIILTAALCLSGCAAPPSRDRLLADTAEVIGVAPEQLTISGKYLSGTTTSYTVKTGSGTYMCSSTAGSVQNLVMKMGVTQLPVCKKVSSD